MYDIRAWKCKINFLLCGWFRSFIFHICPALISGHRYFLRVFCPWIMGWYAAVCLITCNIFSRFTSRFTYRDSTYSSIWYGFCSSAFLFIFTWHQLEIPPIRHTYSSNNFGSATLSLKFLYFSPFIRFVVIIFLGRIFTFLDRFLVFLIKLDVTFSVYIKLIAQK